MAYHLQQQARRLAFYNQPANRTNSNSSDDFSSTNKDNPPTTNSKRPIKRIDANAPLPLLLSALEEDGCVVINNFTTPSTLSAAHTELKPHLESLSAAPPAYTKDKPSTSPSPSLSQQQQQQQQHQTLSLTPLLSFPTHQKLTTLLTTHNPLLQSLTTHFLTLTSTSYTSGGTPVTSTAPPPALSTAAASLLGPSTAAEPDPEPLTRPDAAHHARHGGAAKYVAGRDVSLVALLPLGGAGRVRVAVGSHLWGDGKPDAGEQGVGKGEGGVLVQMERGDALVALGSCYLGRGLGGFGGEGKKAKGEEKGDGVCLLEARFVNGVLRPEWELDSMGREDGVKGKEGC